MPRTLTDIILGVLIGAALLLFINDKQVEILNPVDAFKTLKESRREVAYDQHVRTQGVFVIDSGGDGPDLYAYGSPVDKEVETIYYDFSGDGIRNLTGWVSRKEFILVRDLNNDGKITTPAEIFADPENPGMTALTALDANRDGRIDALDPEYNTLWIWGDSDRNATSEISELHSLAEVGIAAIAIALDDTEQTAPDDIPAHKVATAIGGDGSSLDIYQAFLHYNSRLTEETTREDWMAQGKDKPNGHFAKAPTLIGQGHQLRLFEAMRRSPEVYDAVGKVLDTPPYDYARFMQAMENLIFTWTGTKDIPVDARGPWIDARKLAALEFIIGKPMRFAPDQRANPTKFSKNFVLERWWKMYNGYACPFFYRQIGMGEFYVTDIYYIAGLHAEKLTLMLKRNRHGPRYERRQLITPAFIGGIRKQNETLKAAARPRAGMNADEQTGYAAFIVDCVEYVRDSFTLNNIDPKYLPRMEDWDLFLEDLMTNYGRPGQLDAIKAYHYALTPLDEPVEDSGFTDRFIYFATGESGNPFQIYFIFASAIALFFILRGLGNKYITSSGRSGGVKT